jgi:cytochrome c553
MPFYRIWFVVLAAGLFVVTPSGTKAASAVDPVILAGSCANCHGTDGRSPGSIPSIAGVPYAVLQAKLEAFKTNPAPDATVMPRLMRAYDAAQIEQLARYYSDMKPGAAR